MDLDEAIQHCEEVAGHCYECVEGGCSECEKEHRQLAEWLKELKEYREARAEINQALNDDARGEQNDYERGRKSGIFLCESIISVKLGESSSENPNTCDEAISRQAVDNMLRIWLMPDDAERMILHLDEIPSVTPQQRMGRWIKQNYGWNWQCSECGFVTPPSAKEIFTFCPHCGAKMEVEE